MAGWYRTGTVTLTTGSATVAGAGATLWASALRPGMVFTTDFHTLYEIKTVDGDAQLTLDRPWAGASAAGVAYAVIFGGAAISNAEIVAELMSMVGKWQTREDQYDEWVAGQPDGGPNGDGKYPLTDSKGVTRLVTSPGRLLMLIDNGLMSNVQQVVDMIEDDVARAQQAADKADSAATTLTAYVASADADRQAAEAARDAAALSEANSKTAETNAKASETAAGTSATAAAGAASVATGARDAAQTAQKATEQARDVTTAARDVTTAARDTVVAAVTTAQGYRDQSAAAQTAAAAAQSRAQDAASTAVNAAADSVDAKIHAVAAQVVAEQRRTEAAGFSDTAKAWAINPVGTPVTAGGFSSYHWAEMSRTYAQQAQVIAGGYMFGAVGDGTASRVSAQAAADVLHLVQGAGMIINFDQATRKVTFSSVARAVAAEDPAVTVRLDETSALAYLGLDRSKIDHGAIANVGTHGHIEIDAHLDNATIHVPPPGAGDADKLLKATGAGTFAWVKGAGSGIDADRLDGYSWEEGQEVAATGAVEWIKIGTWNAQNGQGRRLLISAVGAAGYDNNTAGDRGGHTVIVATIGNNLNASVANIQGTTAYYDHQLFTAVKFKQGADRFTYDVCAQRNGYAPFNYRVSTSGTWTHAGTTGQTDPGADSATVRAAVDLGRMLTTADMSQNTVGNTLVQRASDGSINAAYAGFNGVGPAVVFDESDASANNHIWRMIADGQVLAFQTVADGWAAVNNWLEVTRNGATPLAATFKAPVKTSLTALGTSPGNSVQHGEMRSSSGNEDYLRTSLLRKTAGNNWTSGTWRIQRTVDVDKHGFVQFGAGNDGAFSPGVGLGSGDVVRLWVPNGIDDVQVDGQKIWHAGNFDPNSKAGTAVATVGANGLMSATDKQMLNGATSAATANALVTRDSAGAAAFSGVTIGGNAVYHAGNLTGAWLGQDVRTTGAPAFQGVAVQSPGYGKVKLIVGDGAHPGYVAFYDKDDSRWGYMGWNDSNDLCITTENGHGLRFNVTPTVAGNAIIHTGNMSSITPTFAGANMTGGLSLASSWGTNYFGTGSGDGASYDTYNFKLQGWWGMGLSDYAGVVRGIYDFRAGAWNIKGQYNTDAESDASANAASFAARKGAMSSGSFNQVLYGENDTGGKLSVFVNGSTRSADGGPNAVTIRNDGGKLILGNAGQQPTEIVGTSVDFKVAPTINGVRMGALRNSVFTANGTFTVPADVYRLYVEVWGGGGGGPGTVNGAAYYGGSGGGYAAKTIDVTPGQAVSVTVGAGGAGGAPSNTGGNGGTSSFGTFVSASGGGGGTAGGPGTPGSGASGDIMIWGGPGQIAIPSGGGYLGGGGGHCPRGGAGANTITFGPGGSGGFPGGGGASAGTSGGNGGNGGGGMVAVYY